MAELIEEAARPTDPVGRFLYNLSWLLAILGGFLMCVVAVMVTVSVTGRYLFSAPVPGDYDIVGIIAGTAIFAFLPYCQMVRGNVKVDFLTAGIGDRSKAALNGMGSLLYLVIVAIFAWRLYYGMIELRDTNQVLAVVNFYRWWTLPFDILCLIILILTVAYSLVRDMGDVKMAHVSFTDTIKEE